MLHASKLKLSLNNSRQMKAKINIFSLKKHIRLEEEQNHLHLVQASLMKAFLKTGKY